MPSREPGTVPCDTSIAGETAPPSDFLIVDNAVALPARGRVLPAADVPLPDGRPGLFAKMGLLVRRGQRVELLVPTAAVDRLWLGWGSAATPTSRVLVDGCESTQEWIAFAGGYTVRSMGCYTVLVRVNDGPERQVSIGIGKSCL